MNRSSFGRRPQPQRKLMRAEPVALQASPELAVEQSFSLEMDCAAPSLDKELQTWKSERSFKIPWRQLYLMASICFGVASFVLPSDVNEGVDWLLYGLMAMSFYVWLSGRRAKAKP